MTVHELIKQLQDCDKPDAEVRLLIREEGHPTVGEYEVHDVYYRSTVDNTVYIEQIEIL